MLTRIFLSPLPSNSTRKKTSYMKLDAGEWEVESTHTEIDRVRKLEMREGRDLRINLELG